MKIDPNVTARGLVGKADAVFALAARKARRLDKSWDAGRGTPVCTVAGRYSTRGWTEWTQGFQYGCMILAGDALGDDKLIELGRRRTLERMLPHVTHTGVHDHGFNNLSTYGNLLRLFRENRLSGDAWERTVYENAIAASGAVQAARWRGVGASYSDATTAMSPALGYVYSFNGPQSLFIDTMRTIRIMGVAWQLGHALMHEGDRRADLLKRSVLHGLTTNRFLVFHGDSGHAYDVRGRTAHEGVFNQNDGAFRCRSTQQGYSPFSTWTRGLAWAMCGYAEELEFFENIDAARFKESVGLSKASVMKVYRSAAEATCEHYLSEASALDGVPYWDDGAPGLHRLGDWRARAADPFNEHEPVDSSAAAIAAQGLIRLGNHVGGVKGGRYLRAGLTLTETLFGEPYLSVDAGHEGLLLHSVYHRPNGWDHVPAGRSVPCGESSMWGDYHLLELAHLVARMGRGGVKQGYPVFFV